MAAQIVDAAFVKSHIGKLPIVDVRPKELYDEGHIPTALSISLMDFEDAPDADTEAEEVSRAYRLRALGPEDPIIVYCQIGKHAKQCCDLLESRGYSNLFLYSGSFVDWTADPSNPIEK